MKHFLLSPASFRSARYLDNYMHRDNDTFSQYLVHKSPVNSDHMLLEQSPDCEIVKEMHTSGEPSVGATDHSTDVAPATTKDPRNKRKSRGYVLPRSIGGLVKAFKNFFRSNISRFEPQHDETDVDCKSQDVINGMEEKANISTASVSSIITPIISDDTVNGTSQVEDVLDEQKDGTAKDSHSWKERPVVQEMSDLSASHFTSNEEIGHTPAPTTVHALQSEEDQVSMEQEATPLPLPTDEIVQTGLEYKDASIENGREGFKNRWKSSFAKVSTLVQLLSRHPVRGNFSDSSPKQYPKSFGTRQVVLSGYFDGNTRGTAVVVGNRVKFIPEDENLVMTEYCDGNSQQTIYACGRPDDGDALRTAIIERRCS